MRWIFRLIGFVVVLALFAVGLVVFLPSERMAALLETQIEAATGRQVTFEGAVKPSFFPQIGLSTGPVTISNAAWSDGGPILKAESLNVALDVRGLLSGDLLIGDITAVSPQVLLETAADGKVNWSFFDEAPVAETQASAEAPARTISLENLSLTDAAIRFIDRSNGSNVEVSDIDVAIRAPDMAGPLDFDITYRRGGDPLQLSGRVASVQSFLDGANTGVVADLTAGSSSLKFDGVAAMDGSAAGKFDANIASTAKFMQSLGLTAVSLPQGFGRAGRITGSLGLKSSSALTVQNLNADLEGTKISGNLNVLLAATPKISGSLTTSTLDLTPFMGGESSASGSGWSTAPIDASALSAANADLALSIAGIKAGEISLTGIGANVVVDAARGVIDLNSAQGFGGSVTGRFVANNRNGLSMSAKATAASINMRQLLGSLAGYDRVSGTGNASVDVLVVGNTMQAIMSGMRGSGNLALNNGEVRGLALADLFLNQGSDGGSTIFDSVTASYTIDGGVLRNSDLQAALPQFSATGNGKVDLGQQSLDYTVIPSFPKAADGNDLIFPVRIQGPWSSPKIRPDLEAALKQTLQADIDKEVEKAKARAEAEVEKAKERARQEVADEVQKKLGVTLEEGDSAEDVLKKKLEQELGNGLRNLLGGN
ncbi:AsmA family protein [Algirhabdus cladophorae]|uniref:AsmA family protein n=1 Tax=Algirhabdus cladophorae TaxID=3377108 RepID=UPI003B845CD4